MKLPRVLRLVVTSGFLKRNYDPSDKLKLTLQNLFAEVVHTNLSVLSGESLMKLTAYGAV
jgi:hypothetical protein